ncbi:bacterial low temperature requirement A protein-domain-containing protein [Lophiotrema nucula]|uniref:Bacterial low temperature requirement A protein-domain-containing protein n=1 Tax=Lophiotrema nucula TaxID=690887 RepID=A0A6A5ZDV7_9PLEO|nr:bacterial low temperature requirement A protein-domain-containing protein [Lophiotrema nucula]
MGLTFHHGHKRDVDSEKHLRRLHKTLPWIESPLRGADHEKLVFSQRHEANTAELFFDLFFVANLATFTTYHSITDAQYLIAYAGFFGILWSCWFQVTLHDVRFARDSIYERVCKTIQFVVFVGLALVGSGFNPGGQKANNTNFRILCYTLVISRGLLVIQYLVVLFYIITAKFTKLFLPLGLVIATYATAAVVFGAMTPAFREVEQSHRGIYVVWYVVMIVEAASIIAISSIWRMLSFKKTHLMERMSLLTLIVIGEGAIGVTKTVSRLMGKNGLDVEGCFLIMCIITVLVLIWALYFDNFPHGHYGTIRQQVWSCLHFPFQLAIVGVVEGSQQVALARYVLKNYVKIEKSIVDYCYKQNLDGVKLRDSLIKLIEYWQFESKIETYGYTDIVSYYAYLVGNNTGICSKANATEYSNSGEWPVEFYNMTMSMFNGVYQGLGMKLPIDKLEKQDAAEIAIKSWKIVYLYYWTSFCLLITCSIVFLFLIRRHKVDLFDFVSVIARFIALAIGGILIALVASDDALYEFLGSPGVLPTCLALLFLILFFDKLSAIFCNWRLKRSGQPYALEYHEEHHGHDGGHGEHGEIHEHGHSTGHSHHDSMALDHRKSAAWSMYSDTTPLTSATAYPGGDIAMTPLMSPPRMSPPITNPPPTNPANLHGGYQPVSQGQNFGA